MGDSVEKKKLETSLLLVMSAAGNNFLRSIPECQTALHACKKLQQQSTVSLMIRKLGFLNKVLITRFRQGAIMGNHVAKLECQFSTLAAMDTVVKETV